MEEVYQMKFYFGYYYNVAIPKKTEKPNQNQINTLPTYMIILFCEFVSPVTNLTQYSIYCN